MTFFCHFPVELGAQMFPSPLPAEHGLGRDVSRAFIRSWLNSADSIFLGLFLKAEILLVKPWKFQHIPWKTSVVQSSNNAPVILRLVSRVSGALTPAAPKGQTLAFAGIMGVWDNNCQTGSKTNPPDLSSLFEYSCTPLNTEQVSGHRKRFEKVQLATGSLRVMSGVRFSLKPPWSVSNTLALQSSAQFGTIRTGEFCSELCPSLQSPHYNFRKTHTRILFTCLIPTKEDNIALDLSVKHRGVLQSTLLLSMVRLKTWDCTKRAKN